MKVWLCRFAAMVFLTLPCLLQAQGVAPGKLPCENFAFPENQGGYGLARVINEGRLYFLSDVDGCFRDDKACQVDAYIVKGNTVITGRSSGKYRCALYPGAKEARAAWVDQDRLQALPLIAPSSLDAWTGRLGLFRQHDHLDAAG